MAKTTAVRLSKPGGVEPLPPDLPAFVPEIRQIEVIRGPNSALYGFNAVSGVINIITYDPLQEPMNTMTVTGGTQDYAGGSAVSGPTAMPTAP